MFIILVLMRGLKNKRVLITGGASGIGAATATRFLEEGSAVCVLDRDDKGQIRKIKQQLPETLSATVTADVSNLPASPDWHLPRSIRVMGAVDVLINNAGISIRHNFLDITPAEWDKVMAVNLTGVFYMAQTAAQAHVGEGKRRDCPNGLDKRHRRPAVLCRLNATKAGVIELTKSMALELAPKVRVCAVAPGYVMTPMQRAEYTDEMFAAVNAKIPLRRHARRKKSRRLFAFSPPTTPPTSQATSTPAMVQKQQEG